MRLLAGASASTASTRQSPSITACRRTTLPRPLAGASGIPSNHNHAGGILGGISSGQDIVVSLALKPTSSIILPGQTINIHGQPVEVVTTGRHDPCVGIRGTPIAEAMLALVLMDHYLRFRAQCADVVSPTPVITR